MKNKDDHIECKKIKIKHNLIPKFGKTKHYHKTTTLFSFNEFYNTGCYTSKY